MSRDLLEQNLLCLEDSGLLHTMFHFMTSELRQRIVQTLALPCESDMLQGVNAN